MIPSPLHPAIVHFPIVLILLGTIVAMAAIFTSRWHLKWAATVILVLAALGTAAAVATGDEDGEAIEHSAGVGTLLEQHAHWAKRTEGFAIAAAALAVIALFASRWRVAGQVTRGASAAVAIAASVCVFETGHRGGQLVYRHGAGVNLAAAPTGADPTPTAQAKPYHDDNR